jgi:hypothetical protein
VISKVIADAPHLYIYRTWCILGGAVLILLIAATVSFFPAKTYLKTPDSDLTTDTTAVSYDNVNVYELLKSSADTGENLHLNTDNTAGKPLFSLITETLEGLETKMTYGKYNTFLNAMSFIWLAASLLLTVRNVLQYIGFLQPF